jgi:hypothetical protein
MDNFKYVQAQPFFLAGAGVIVGGSTVTLTSFAQIDGTLLTMADFGTIGFGTVEPGNGANEEQICFTGVSQNANGTATLTGVSSVSFVSPYTKTANFQKNHVGGTTFVISNTSGFYDNLVSKNDDETIAGIYTFTNPNVPRMDTDPTYGAGTELYFATKQYVDDTAFAGAPNATTTQKGIVQEATNADYLAGTKTGSTGADLFVTPDILLTHNAEHRNLGLAYGTTLAYGDIVYADSGTGRYLKALATTTTNLDKVAAVAFESGVNGEFKQVLFPGSIVFTGGPFTIGSPVFLSDTGVASSTPGTTRKVVGVALTAGAWQFNPCVDTPTATPTANKIPIADGSGLLNAWVTGGFGGTGADGALTVSSGTTNFDLAGASYFEKNFTSISITGTGAVTFTNPSAAGTKIIFKSQGAVTITTSATRAIDLRNLGATGGAGAAAGTGTSGTNATNWIAGLVGGGNGGGPGAAGADGAGGAGGSSASNAGTAGGGGGGGAAGGSPGSTAYFNSLSAQYILAYSRPGAGGGGGGSGNNGALTGGNGSRGAGSLDIECNGALNYTGTIDATGAAGANGASGGGRGSGGGGGGAGGTVVILATSITANSGTTNVGGGAGGTVSAAAGAGGAGADGYSYIGLNTEFF